MNLGEDFNISLKDIYYLEHKYEASAFLRTYMPIGRSKIFGLFNEARLTYGYGGVKTQPDQEQRTTVPSKQFRTYRSVLLPGWLLLLQTGRQWKFLLV